MMKIKELIIEKFSELSIGKRKVAEYVINNIEAFSYANLAKISKETKVSETTIIRFAYSLGFESFSDMQKSLRKEILSSTISNESAEKDIVDKQKGFFTDLISKEISILKNTEKNLNIKELELAILKLHQAEHVFSIGARSSYSAALWFGRALSIIKPNVHIINTLGEEHFVNLVNITSNSVVVCISFSRYAKSTHIFTQLAKQKNAFIISITDSSLSPLASISDVVILTESNRDESGTNTISSVTALLNMLFVGVQRIDPKNSYARLNELEKLYTEADLIFE